MKEQDISRIITTLEQVKNISGKKLCVGLCTPIMMTKIESGEKIPGKLLLDALLQRLGESPNKMETLISQEEYENLSMREEIEGNILEEHYEQACKLINKYMPQQEKTEFAERQWLYTQLYYIAKGRGQDQNEYVTYLETALAATVPDWKSIQKTELLLSEKEVSLFLVLIQEFIGGAEMKNAKSLLNSLIRYMERHFTDEEELLKIYPKAIVLYAECHKNDIQAKKVISYCEKALELVTHHNALYYLLELLDILIERLPYVGREREIRKFQKQRDSLAAVYKEYGYGESQNKREMQSRKREYQLFHEVIRTERLAHGLTHAKLIDGIYSSPETLSRLENGKTEPRGRKFEQLMKRLDVDIARYNAQINVENYGIYQLEREFTLCEGRFEHEKAKKIYDTVAAQIDNEDRVNRQWLIFKKAILDLDRKRIDTETALARCMEALELTYKYQSNNVYRIPLRQEAEIFNVIAQCYIEVGEREKAFKLRNKLIRIYRKSKMGVRYHGMSYSLLLSNYALEKGNADITDGVIELCDEGVNLLLQIGSGSLLGKYQLIKGCVYELLDKEKSHRELSRKYICHAAHLCDLFQKDKNRDQIRTYYNEHYDKNYSWD